MAFFASFFPIFKGKNARKRSFELEWIPLFIVPLKVIDEIYQKKKESERNFNVTVVNIGHMSLNC